MEWSEDELACLRHVVQASGKWTVHDRWEFASDMLARHFGKAVPPEECRKEAQRRGWEKPPENPN